MKTEGCQICEAVLSPGREKGRLSLVEVKRSGSLLLALPLKRRNALATLGLYQPQRLKGRALKAVMRLFVAAGLHRLLPRIELGVGDRGLFSGFEENVEFKSFGFLLGSADSRMRNLIGLVEMEGALHVVKAGCGEAAAVVQEECRAMREYSAFVRGAPECRGSFEIENGVAYVAELVKGRSPRGSRGDELVFALLEDWLQAGERVNVADLDCWKALAAALDEGEMKSFSELSGLEVLSPVMHGDFAPWNIKVNGGGQVKVLDWEFASQRGMPGWDWLHFQVQRLRLVKGASAEKIIAACRELLNGAGVKSYLERSGLDGREDALLGSYLYYSGRVHDYPREDLIEVWKSGSQEVRESGS